jgi:hypothetical protein
MNAVQLLQIATLMVLVVAMVPALAHALELPGKLRLAREAYFTVQPIYYPGFTFAGFAEPVALLCSLALLVLTPTGSAEFWLTAAAFGALVAMHAVYWLVTHPVNKFWLRDEQLSAAGKGFFSLGSQAGAADWRALRDRWEYSHVARAALSLVGLLALALVVSPASG